MIKGGINTYREFIRNLLLKFSRSTPEEIEHYLDRFMTDPRLLKMQAEFSKMEFEIFDLWTDNGFHLPPKKENDSEEPEIEAETIEEAQVVEDSVETVNEKIEVESVESEQKEEEVGEEESTSEETEEEAEAEIAEAPESSVEDDEVAAENPDENLPTDPNDLDGDGLPDQIEIKPDDEPEPAPEEISLQFMPVHRIKIQLPNAMKGKAYHAEVDLTNDGEFEITALSIDGLDDTGLVFDEDSRTISGKPETHGDLTLGFRFRIGGMEDHEENLYKEAILIINPDPRSLWKDIPSDENITYAKPDSDSDRNRLGEKVLIAASQRGRSHAHEGKPRDDDFEIFYSRETEFYFLSVADGAGSAEFSRRGSQIACTTATDVLKSGLTLESVDKLNGLLNAYKADPTQETRKPIGDILYQLFGKIVYDANNKIAAEAAEQGVSSRHFHTTLLTGIARKFDAGWFFASYWVGDGALGIYKQGDEIRLMGASDGGEYAGQTVFLTMGEMREPKEIYTRMRFELHDDFDAFILMTDGVSDPKIQTDANLLRVSKWDELWEDMKNEVGFDPDDEKAHDKLLSWLDFWSPGDHDDRTIAILF